MAPGDHKQHKRTPEIVAFLDQFHAHGAKADYDAYTKCLHPDGVWCGPEREAIYTVAELKTLLKSDLWKDGVKPPILPKEGDSSPSRNSLATEEHKKNYAWNWVCRTRKVDVVEGFFDGAVADVVVAHVDEILEDQNLEDVEKMGCMLRGSAVLVSEAVGTGWRLLRYCSTYAIPNDHATWFSDFCRLEKTVAARERASSKDDANGDDSQPDSAVVGGGWDNVPYGAVVHRAANLPSDLNTFLNQFHSAADQANLMAYIGAFQEGGRFLGTDHTENWTREKLKAYAKPTFLQGEGWSYSALKRNAAFVASNRLLPGEDKAQDTGESLYTIALVEETLESSKATFMGLAEAPFRGTAVLLKKKSGVPTGPKKKKKTDGLEELTSGSTGWTILQYHLHFAMDSDKAARYGKYVHVQQEIARRMREQALAVAKAAGPAASGSKSSTGSEGRKKSREPTTPKPKEGAHVEVKRHERLE